MAYQKKPYKVVGAYDSETTNINVHGDVIAFPILHQLGITDGTPIDEIDATNVEQIVTIELYRHALDLYEWLDDYLEQQRDYVPVICCHNLAFDMYGLAPWLNRHDVKVLAKSLRKPITFSIKNSAGEVALVLWDTLIFSQQSLDRMGKDCGYAKAVGSWDYDLIRTPSTPLSEKELDYAKRDIYTLMAWLGWWVRRNPDIESSMLGLNVVTKTGIVRTRRKVRFDQLKGHGLKEKVGRYWMYLNRVNAPKDNDELFTMFAATRGGAVFCSSENASRVFDLDETMCIAGYDDTSMHPSQMVSHFYPIGFKCTNARLLTMAFDVIASLDFKKLLDHWDKPFPVAFYASFKITNLRLKAGSIFERDGIAPFASARYSKSDDDNGDRENTERTLSASNYRDHGVNVKTAFGKIISADEITLFLTELGAYELCTCYDYDSVEGISGYTTGRFVRPSDMSTISVMQFYRAKNLFKKAREEYFSTGTIKGGDDLKKVGIPQSIVSSMENGTLSDTDVDATYLALKADLN